MTLETFRRGAAWAAAVALLLTIGCGNDTKTAPNLPPTVAYLERPAEGATVGSRVTIRWTASDPDGAIARYEVSLDSETEFESVTDSVRVLNFTKQDGTDSNPQPHVFRVRAVDDRGATSETLAASFLVGVFNDPPQVQFTDRPPTEGYAGASIRFAWRGQDTDGVVDHFEFVLDDTASSWTTTSDTTVTIDFSSGSPVFKPSPGGGFSLLNRPVEYTLFLRAIDDGKKPSVVIRASFLAGPENVAPTLTLLTAPGEPPFVVDGVATWTWKAEDSDGEILQNEYAVDLQVEDDWKRWDATSLTLAFDRTDGTAEDPVRHTMFLRTEDNNAAYSDVVTRDFLVGVPNRAPVIAFASTPPPTTVSYRFTYGWTATDDEGVAFYEYAVDDSVGEQGESLWTRTDSLTAQIDFSAPNVDRGTCTPVGCRSFGDHVFYLRATDVLGARSATISSEIMVFTFTPVTTITDPTGTGGAVVGSESLTVRWTLRDLDILDTTVRSTYLVMEVADFASFPDPDETFNEPGLSWLDVPAGQGNEVTLSLASGKRYLVALRAVDAAEAPESSFEYGRNVLQVTVP